MARFDLKPLTPEIIQELALEEALLWQVRLNETVYGPFETLSLKHYARDNESTLRLAEVAHWAQEDWCPFFENPEFKAGPQTVEDNGQAFWVLDNGLKSGPFTFAEVEKCVKGGQFDRYHDLSVDQGYSWKKISHCETFQHLFTATCQLPLSSPGANILNLAELRPQRSQNKDVIPDLAHVAHVQESERTLKIDELELTSNNEVPVAKSMNWAMVAGVSFAVVFVIVGAQVSGSKQDNPLEASAEPEVTPARAPATKKSRSLSQGRKAFEKLTQGERSRGTASFPRSPITQPPVYQDVPTHIETHQADDYGPDLRERESSESEARPEPQVAEEPSIVDNQPAQQEDQTIETAMNVDQLPAQEPSPEQPVEEAPQEQQVEPLPVE